METFDQMDQRIKAECVADAIDEGIVRSDAYTPGPWEFDGVCVVSSALKGRKPFVTVEGEPCSHEAGLIALVYSCAPEGDYESGRHDANARLIAAAPDLLAACKLALNAFERNDNIDWGVLESAIAKAEGR